MVNCSLFVVKCAGTSHSGLVQLLAKKLATVAQIGLFMQLLVEKMGNSCTAEESYYPQKFLC